MRGVIALLLVPLLAYGLVCMLLFLAQRKLVYLPEYTRVARSDTGYLLDRGDAVLRGWIVNPGQRSAILYFGGNGEAVQANRDDFERWFPDRSVYLLAYRGYGASDGQPSQAALLEDAIAFHDDVRARHPDAPVSVIGRSLGSAVASHVAAERPVDRLALVTPFDSLSAVAAAHYRWLPVRWLMRDPYPAAEMLRGYAGPLLVLRAGRDEVIPAANTDALIATLPGARVVSIDGAGHNDLHLPPGYGEALTSFMR